MKYIALSFMLLSLLLTPLTRVFAQSTHWTMAGANPGRTSWSTATISDANSGILWALPIEAYIEQEVQIVSSDSDADNLIYISTVNGVYAITATTGAVAWRYDTKYPIGHSPTVFEGKIYFGAYDKKMHARNSQTGAPIWQSPQAKAGFSSNPLVVRDPFTGNQTRIVAGNRDGYLYAYTDAGQIAWQYPRADQEALGPISNSAAYANGTIYFVSNDMFAYAINIADGTLKWKSPNKLPGERFASWWPVLFDNYVVFSPSSGYRGGNPGTDAFGVGNYHDLQELQFYGPLTANTYSGTIITSDGSQGWPTGYRLLNSGSSVLPSTLQSYHGQTGNGHYYRRALIALNKDTGTETLTLPFLFTGTHSGNRYPPIINPTEQSLISSNYYFAFPSTDGYSGISRMTPMAFKPSSSYLRLLSGNANLPHFAVDEPQALSGIGNNVYDNLCCDRQADNLSTGYNFWPYGGNPGGIYKLVTNYDQMWQSYDGGGLDRLWYYYAGLAQEHGYNRNNGYYQSHGNQNPLIPYKGMLFTHRSNAIIAIGPGGTRCIEGSDNTTRCEATTPINPLPPVRISTTTSDSVTPPTTEDLQVRLQEQVNNIVGVYQAGNPNRFLKPGYFNTGQIPNANGAETIYFNNPGDTLSVLSQAYNLLPLASPLRPQLKTYLADYYQTYFGSTLTSRVGWNTGSSRNAMDFPPDITFTGSSLGDVIATPANYPQRNIYALYQYAKIFSPTSERPSIQAIFDRITQSNLLATTCPAIPRIETPWQYNDCIAALFGYLKLQDLLGITRSTSATASLNSQLSTRTTTFNKDFPGSNQRTDRKFNGARNFMFLTQELGDHFRQNAGQTLADEAVREYSYLAPFWFVSANDNSLQESVMHHLHDVWLFSARAYILGERRTDLYPYLDVPTFEKGDLLYIQNLITLLEGETGSVIISPTLSPTTGAESPTTTVTLTTTLTPTPTPDTDLDDNQTVNFVDFQLLISSFGRFGAPGFIQADIEKSGLVDIYDFNIFVHYYGL